LVCPITVVGTGPGHGDYLLPVAAKAVEQADCLLGSKRALALFKHLHKPEYVIDGDLSRVIPVLKDLRGKQRVVVLVSGDPGFYSLLTFLKRHFPDGELEVIPGISSVQLAFARLKKAWQDAVFFSVHGRSPEGLAQLVKPGRTVVVLTDNKNTPRVVAQFLKDKVPGDPLTYICDSLGTPAETVLATRLSRVDREMTNSVMVITYD